MRGLGEPQAVSELEGRFEILLQFSLEFSGDLKAETREWPREVPQKSLAKKSSSTPSHNSALSQRSDDSLQGAFWLGTASLSRIVSHTNSLQRQFSAGMKTSPRAKKHDDLY